MQSPAAQNQPDWKFLVGAALSVYQNAGGSNTNWSDFEGKRNIFGQPTIYHGERCGHANGFWDNFEDDIKRAQSLNSNCLRLSIEWGRIEPQQGTHNAAAIQHYHDMFDCILRWVSRLLSNPSALACAYTHRLSPIVRPAERPLRAGHKMAMPRSYVR